PCAISQSRQLPMQAKRASCIATEKRRPPNRITGSVLFHREVFSIQPNFPTGETADIKRGGAAKTSSAGDSVFRAGA
ncbi:MAG: hypothetical protein KIS67_24930, partial [Verrucomicrobiae bacterium]|nr:hypothetical protein [Verrucomicrobiae bacterium]